MTKNGTFIDPRKLKSPPAEPITTAERGVFEAERSRQLAFLGSSAPMASAPVAAASLLTASQAAR
jgi:hypothetical protein